MADESNNSANPSQPIMEQDSSTTKAEKMHRHQAVIECEGEEIETAPSPRKRVKLDKDSEQPSVAKRVKGTAPIKAEYLLHPNANDTGDARRGVEDDDAAEGADDRYNKTGSRDSRDNRKNKKKDKKSKQKGQNTSRTFGSSHDKIKLCATRATSNEFSPKHCPFGDKCRMEHDLRKYLSVGRREDLTTFRGQCPVYEVRGFCDLGWKCRFHSSHSEERETEDNKKELILLEDTVRKAEFEKTIGPEGEVGVVNVVPKQAKIDLQRRKIQTPSSDAYLKWVNANIDAERNHFDRKPKNSLIKDEDGTAENGGVSIRDEDGGTAIKTESQEAKDQQEDNRATYTEPPFRPSEKRRLYYGPETPVLAPLTTQGNLPFRRLCVELGAQVTWSEMAMGLPLLQGEKGEWALMKAHESEIRAPSYLQKNTVVKGYDNATDLRFGAQIAANKPWLATKVVEVLTSLCPHLRAIDLNCGCPINLVCEGGAGSALLDSPSKLENTLRGMNYVSGSTPITVKIRMGTKDSQPTAEKLIKRLVLGGYEAVESGKGTSGVAAITLHGRSKQQRYTRSADWSYIAECSALINRLKSEESNRADTIHEADTRDLANEGHIYFIGNGDCYSHEDYYTHLRDARVDSVMVARGALIKPWIFEEIEKGQYLDKSASERLAYVEKFAKYGLQTWGSDEMGIGTTRRFLLEWLSFACRYVPIGLLEHLPPNIQDRPPRYKGRNELESLMSSDNYKDWIKISEMFLGPAHPDFKFEPKHKSNSYEIEAEG